MIWRASQVPAMSRLYKMLRFPAVMLSSFSSPLSLSLSSLTRSDKNSGQATTLDRQRHSWSTIQTCFTITKDVGGAMSQSVGSVESACGSSRMIGIAGGDGHRSFCFDELKPGKGRGGGEVKCGQYYVVGRE